MPRTTVGRRLVLLISLGVAWIAGCRSGTEAVVDGFYSGISDTVAAIVSDALTPGAD